MKTFKQHFREAADPNDPKVIVAQAKAILDQNKKDKELFAASIKKLEGNKAAKRIKYSQFNADPFVKTMIVLAVDKAEDVLGIPKSTKYVMKLLKGKNMGRADGRVAPLGKKYEIELRQEYTQREVEDYFPMMKNLAHEMIHVWQFWQISKGNDKYRRAYPDQPYMERPSEIDAFGRMDSVFNKMLAKMDGLYLGSKLKIKGKRLWRRVNGKPTGFDFQKHIKLLIKEVPELKISETDQLEFEQIWEPVK